jgi:hypothetical protein
VTNHQSTLLKSQKSENITHTAAEAWHHARLWFYGYISKLRYCELCTLNLEEWYTRLKLWRSYKIKFSFLGVWH